MIFSLNASSFSGDVKYTLFSKLPQNQKYSGVNSGEPARHRIGPNVLNHLGPNFRLSQSTLIPALCGCPHLAGRKFGLDLLAVNYSELSKSSDKR
jgi:hypothetical protein